MNQVPLFPEQASTIAPAVDNLYFFILGVCVFFAILVFVLVTVFAIKYRRRSESEVPALIEGNNKLELFWTLVPLMIAMVMFFWGAKVFFHGFRPPKNAIDIFCVGKQWMWKFQHEGGRSEINELHIPVGRPVKVTLGSEDVVHSFFVPAFRVKMDVVPGRYTYVWFEATKPGKYHLFCTQYCGTNHSQMIGWVYVQTPLEYEQWLGQSSSAGSSGQGGTSSSKGAELFNSLGCITCHKPGSKTTAPLLEGLYGHKVALQNGQSVTADDAYIRESILNPTAKVVSGYQPVMPSFRGRVSEEDLMSLLAYIKSLGTSESPAPKR
jgi:cytochrome c oxidase subunit 2